MHRKGIAGEQAFNLLVSASQKANIKLHDVADLEAVAAALDQARSREILGKLWARGRAESGQRLGRWVAKRREPNREYCR